MSTSLRLSLLRSARSESLASTSWRSRSPSSSRRDVEGVREGRQAGLGSHHPVLQPRTCSARSRVAPAGGGLWGFIPAFGGLIWFVLSLIVSLDIARNFGRARASASACGCWDSSSTPSSGSATRGTEAVAPRRPQPTGPASSRPIPTRPRRSTSSRALLPPQRVPRVRHGSLHRPRPRGPASPLRRPRLQTPLHRRLRRRLHRLRRRRPRLRRPPPPLRLRRHHRYPPLRRPPRLRRPLRKPHLLSPPRLRRHRRHPRLRRPLRLRPLPPRPLRRPLPRGRLRLLRRPLRHPLLPSLRLRRPRPRRPRRSPLRLRRPLRRLLRRRPRLRRPTAHRRSRLRRLRAESKSDITRRGGKLWKSFPPRRVAGRRGLSD